MDARVKFDSPALPLEAPANNPDTPPEARLDMPEQAASGVRRRVHGETDGRWRLAAVVAPALIVTALASFQSWQLMSAEGMTALEWLGLALFAINLAWVSAAAATAVAGAALLMTARPQEGHVAPFRTRSHTAIVFPIRNEHLGRVMGGARAVHDALVQAKADHAFEIFFLSDTSDTALARDEEAAFQQLRLARPEAKVFYRRRTLNHGRKAGNIADFVQRWGARYTYMAVFDADSLMSASALVQLVQRMDDRPRTALIQTLPAIVNAQTLFARTQQFAMRAYGQIFGAGLAWWSGGAGNFWGHNAIIRVRAFAAHASLPVLPGKGPLGGHILSHDFVEAALLRRAGWRVEIAPEISGSYEECPPTLTDMSERDRRWAQGNLQHISLIGARGFDPVSRAHIIAGLMGYLSAPLWFALVIAGVGLAWLRPSVSEGALSGDGGAGALLFAFTALIVLSPKLLALLLWSAGRLPGWSMHPRFIAGVLVEAAVSAATAPVLMLNQTISIASTLLGKDTGWRPQTRGACGPPSESLMVRYGVHVVLGLALAVAAVAHDGAMAAWTAPVALGLMLAAPVSAMLSRAPRRHGLLWRLTATPEDMSPPAVVRSAGRAALQLGATSVVLQGPDNGLIVRLLPQRPDKVPQAGG